MSDLEIVTACAEAMGLQTIKPPGYRGVWLGTGCADATPYNPLTDDAQNAALDDVLLKHGRYEMRDDEFIHYNRFTYREFIYGADMTIAANRRRARAECVAKLEGVK